MKGLTVITGRSNIGKSALIRAMTAAFFGLPGDYYIRRGEAFCGVVVEGEKLKLVWRKVGKPTPERQTALQVNGTTHTKLGREHGELTKGLGVVELQTSSVSLRPQVAAQADPIFLLTDSETTVAEVFKLLGRVDVITNAQQLAGKDRRDAESLKKVRDADRLGTQAVIGKMVYLTELRSTFTGLKVEVDGLLQQEEGVKAWTSSLNWLKEQQPIKVPEPLVEPESPTVLFEQQEVLRRLVQGLSELGSLEKDHLLVEQALEAMTAKKALMEKELGVCPVCQRAFD